MSIEVMKQALEALEEAHPKPYNESVITHFEAIVSLRQAIADLESQEPVAWTSDDMAYRPNGLPQDFVKHEVESVYDWSDWVCPNPEQYFMKCCDCGLVHEMQFKVAKYKLGNECEFVEDTNLQAVFKARRTHPPQRKPLTDTEVSLVAHNEDPEDWNSLEFRECWHEGFVVGFRAAEECHKIGV